MTEDRIPTEQELDALLFESPRFDLEAVKRRTLSRIAPPQKARKDLPLRGLFIAALVCALSVSAVAAGYVGDGQLARVFNIIRKPQVEEYSAEPLPDPEPVPVVEEPPAPAPVPVPEPEPEPEPELPVLDEKIAAALEVTPQQAETLRPAVQNVDLTAEDREVKMTVLQSVGDMHTLYLTVRFDFPETVPVAEDLEFRKLKLRLDKSTSFGYSKDVLERTESSVTYLFALDGTNEPLLGQTMTVTAEDYGRDTWVDEDCLPTFAQGEKTMMVLPDKHIYPAATADEVAALATAPVDHTETPADGLTVDYLTDGTMVAHYDGSQGRKWFTIFHDEQPRVEEGNLWFDIMLEGSWEQSWGLEYDALSLGWTGEVVIFEGAPPVKEITLSAFSWTTTFPQSEIMHEVLPEEWQAQLLHADGSVTDFPMKRTNWYSTQDDCIIVSNQFSNPIDVSGVTALIINGVEFPLTPAGQ